MTDPNYCEIYGNIAVAQNEQNKSQGCWLTGKEWSSDKQYHINWCVDEPASKAEKETATRVKQLFEHGVKFLAGADKRCNIYAHVAVAQHEANFETGCNRSEPKWHSDYYRHYQWCLQVDEDKAKSEMMERMNQLTQRAENND